MQLHIAYKKLDKTWLHQGIALVRLGMSCRRQTEENVIRTTVDP
jgi:hypothetical protein